MTELRLGRSVTIDQAAELLQVSRRTVYNRIRDGRLQTIRTIGGSQRVLVSSLQENMRRPMWAGPTEREAADPGDRGPRINADLGNRAPRIDTVRPILGLRRMMLL